MIDFESALVFFDCPYCRGIQVDLPAGWCDRCSNAGEVPVYVGTLFQNIAIAAGLCLSRQSSVKLTGVRYGKTKTVSWRPGCGVPFPGIRRAEI